MKEDCPQRECRSVRQLQQTGQTRLMWSMMHKDPDDHLGYSEVPDRLRRTPHFPPPNKSAQPVEHRDFTLRAGEEQREEGYAASDAAAKIH